MSPSEIQVEADFYAQLVENLPLGAFRVSRDGTILFCNTAFAHILGFESASDLFGCRMVELVASTESQGRRWKTGNRTRGYREVRTDLVKSDGSSIHCSVISNHREQDDDRIWFTDGVIQEIPQNSRRSESSALLDEMADRTDRVIVLVNLDGHLLDINEKGARFLGLPKNHIVGKPVADLVVSTYKDLLSLFLSDTVQSGQKEGIITIGDERGNERSIEFSAVLMKYKGERCYIKIVARDLTDILREQEELLRREKLRGVLEMAGGVAHRINQPITTINNIVSHIISHGDPTDPHYEQILSLREHLRTLSDLGIKIANIDRYEPMEYAAGMNIVDIDKASRGAFGES